jgi:hypothetical protein
VASLIHTGEVASAKGVPDDRLLGLANRWRAHAAIQFPDDCRGLLLIVEETVSERVCERLGFKSPDDFYQRELHMAPEHVRIAHDWLLANPGKSVGWDEIPALAGHGGDRKSADQDGNANLKPSSNDAEYVVRRLKRDNPELADQVVRGELSPNAAAIKAGFRKRTVRVPLDPNTWAEATLRHFTPEQAYAIARVLLMKTRGAA